MKSTWAILEGRLLSICTALEKATKDVSPRDLVVYVPMREAMDKLEEVFETVSARRQEEDEKKV